MSKSLLIVESPTKAKTIEKYLGSGFKVVSSYGHIRDLPSSASEIPEKLKVHNWSRLGIDIENDFDPIYVVPEKKKKTVKLLKDELGKASELFLATDEDREGESISWHLVEVLNPKIPIKRLVFNEITKKAIQASIKNAREINSDLVKAQETRRILDRLYGYTVSPLLWKKMLPKLSAGRVQSVATRLLVERERERISFRTAVYWDLKATFKKDSEFEAELVELKGRKIAIGKDFDPKTGKLKSADVELLNKEQATKLANDLKQASAKVTEVESKPFTNKPSAPFTTSTLQQEANRKFGFTAKRTMSVAQNLYENGFITYMRTDSTTLSTEALNAARSLIAAQYGKEYLTDQPRVYQTKVKNAQEAHEAIRPAGEEFVETEEIKKKLGIEAFKLYDLIWKRTVASQMQDASGTRVIARIQVSDAVFRASGKTISFPGFLRAYVEGSDDPEADLADQEKILPKLSSGDQVKTINIEALEHQTKAPARFTEGALIKELERLGIGRPSTWATVVDVILSRGYAFKRSNALVPTFLAMALTKLMEQFFTKLVDYNFTAGMEDDLDAIARGEKDNLAYLKKFYFGNGHPGLDGLVKNGEKIIDPREVCGIDLGKSDAGKEIEVRIGRFGAFISNGETRSSVPQLMAPDELNLEKAEEILIQASRGPQSLGTDPQTSKNVYVKTGRFGPYVQLGETSKDKKDEKPKMASLLVGMLPENIDLQTALKLLSLPKNLGKHPTLSEDIEASNGRFGPYVKCGKETRSLPTDLSPLEVTFEQAVELLNQPKTRGRRGGAPKPPLKELGVHPGTELKLVVKDGRFGPYVTDGKINASLLKGMSIESLTLEDGIALIEARAAKLANQEEE